MILLGVGVHTHLLTELCPLLCEQHAPSLEKTAHVTVHHYCHYYKLFHVFRLNVPVGDPRVRRPPPQTVVEAAHIVKHILPS